MVSMVYFSELPYVFMGKALMWSAQYLRPDLLLQHGLQENHVQCPEQLNMAQEMKVDDRHYLEKNNPNQ